MVANNPMPRIAIPEWLERIGKGDIPSVIPLRDLVVDSCFFPFHKNDGNPLKRLNGHVLSFIYIDAFQPENWVVDALKRDGFLGYENILSRHVAPEEMLDSGWSPRILPSPTEMSRYKEFNYQPTPFAHWSVWRRLPDFSEDHGAKLFSLLNICGEMSASYQWLYHRFQVVPKVVILQEVDGYTGNWEISAKEGSFFHKVMKGHPAGMPQWLLSEYFDKDNDNKCCFPEYGDPLTIGLFRDYSLCNVKLFKLK